MERSRADVGSSSKTNLGFNTNDLAIALEMTIFFLINMIL